MAQKLRAHTILAEDSRSVPSMLSRWFTTWVTVAPAPGSSRNLGQWPSMYIFCLLNSPQYQCRILTQQTISQRLWTHFLRSMVSWGNYGPIRHLHCSMRMGSERAGKANGSHAWTERSLRSERNRVNPVCTMEVKSHYLTCVMGITCHSLHLQHKWHI